MLHHARTACFVSALSIALAAGAAEDTPKQSKAANEQTDAQTERVHVCYPGEDGNLTGQIVEMPIEQGYLDLLEARRGARGPVDNRVDLVMVGDGYTAGQMATFHQHADNVAADFFNYEPYKSYEPYFRITKVEVASNESGVDNDPTQGINRDTALDMAYWGNGIERLLIVDVTKAYTHANAGAADVDQVLAIANSSKYGGAGYSSSNLGTVAGGNASAVDIAINENGHSFGGLADEYDYGGPVTYIAPEPEGANVSTYDHIQQIIQSRKWYQWVGVSMSGLDGPVSSFEGAVYSLFGVYRPTDNSMMRNLGRPFNPPSAEKLIIEIYWQVNPIDDGLLDGTAWDVSDNIWIIPMQPIGHSLTIEWTIDGTLDHSFDGMSSINLANYGLSVGPHSVSVRVADDTPMVRDQVLYNHLMVEERSYTVHVNPCNSTANLNGDDVLNLQDLFAFLALFNAQLPEADLAAPFGDFNLQDVFAYLAIFNAGCNP